MIRNYIKTAWRSIITKKFYAILNISGLAIAIACCLLIYLYTNYHLSFDNYHKNANSIYRIVCELHLDKTEYDKGSSVAIYRNLKSESPQVKQAALSINNQSFIVNIGGDYKKRFKEEKNIAFTNSGWFKLFTYNWIAGNAAQLDEPNTAALTQKQAEKYFGNTNPINQILMINGQQIKIIGVIADRPFNTDLKSDVYLSFSSFKNINPKVENEFFTGWGNISSANSVFVSLKNNSQKALVEKELASATKKKFGNDAKYFTFKLLPLKEIHFDMRYGGTVQKPLLITLAVIGFLIILIAGINYINIMIARQSRRSAEIGTRKILGASANQLFTHFMAESVLNCLIALVTAIILVTAILPEANLVLFADEPLYIISYPNLILFAGLLLLFIIAGTGIYPALLLSRLNVFRALKNNTWNLSAGINRKVLIVLQNTVAQTLIACTIIIVMQVQFLKNTDKGFDRKSVVMIPVGKISASQKEQLRQSLNSISEVQSYSYCNRSPSSDSQRGATVQFNNRAIWEVWPARFAIGDSAYCSTFGLHIVAGRNIRNNQPTPEFLINQTMAQKLHVKSTSDIIGRNLSAGDAKGIIVGIVKDFNVKSLIEPIEPAVLLETKELQTNLAIKLSGEHTSTALSTLQKNYLHIFPDQVFSYQFVDEQIAQLYKKESLQQKLIWSASFIAIFISSLGLLGLISLVTLQRTKEIGIRKVLGASVAQISLLLSKDFLAMISIAFLIATPIAWFAMSKWLQSFAYRIQISWWIFALAALIALVIALATVSFQAVKAALANPVKSLRSE